EETNPYEVGLGKFVDLEKEIDFIGKAALKEINSTGIKRKLVGLEIHTEPLYQTAQPWPIEWNDKKVGTITSAVYSPDLEKNIAFALVAVESAKMGTRLNVDLGEEKAAATVTPIPFIDNRAKVWKGIK
ncbi:MAG: aminomethyltransferase family protein, partial [Chloroflexota bacterium]